MHLLQLTVHSLTDLFGDHMIDYHVAWPYCMKCVSLSWPLKAMQPVAQYVINMV